MKKHMRITAWVLSLMMLVSILPSIQVNAAAKPNISSMKVTLTVGKTKL